jgi:hypothetical protein
MILFPNFFFLNAQVKENNKIILWDVTGSMKENGIWGQVKDLLLKNIYDTPDKSTEVIIIPFQDDVFPEKRFVVGNEVALEDFNKWVSGYQIPKGNHGTNICLALEKATEFIQKTKKNTVYLLTDGVQEPVRAEMLKKYPSTCLEEFICEKWCAQSKESNAYLVYYQLFGKKEAVNLKECATDTCGLIFLPPPGPYKSIELYSINPITTIISKDNKFFEKPLIRIPVTTDLPKDQLQAHPISGTISAVGFVCNFQANFNGSEITFELSKEAVSRLKVFCKKSSKYSELSIKLKVKESEESKVVITPNSIPLKIKSSGERWMEIKVLPE